MVIFKDYQILCLFDGFSYFIAINFIFYIYRDGVVLNGYVCGKNVLLSKRFYYLQWRHFLVALAESLIELEKSKAWTKRRTCLVQPSNMENIPVIG